MKNIKKTLIIITLLVTVLIIIFFPYIRAEYLTFRYGDEFIGLEQQTNMMDPATYHKVVKYSKNTATVFYVLSGKGGSVIEFAKDENNLWQMIEWNAIWSHYGSADNFYWPYYR